MEQQLPQPCSGPVHGCLAAHLSCNFVPGRQDPSNGASGSKQCIVTVDHPGTPTLLNLDPSARPRCRLADQSQLHCWLGARPCCRSRLCMRQDPPLCGLPERPAFAAATASVSSGTARLPSALPRATSRGVLPMLSPACSTRLQSSVNVSRHSVCSG